MRKLLLITVASLSLGTPALALNPQPLPPGFRSHYVTRNAVAPQTIQRPGGWHHPLPVCHSVQPGDPRKQPPMLVCH